MLLDLSIPGFVHIRIPTVKLKIPGKSIFEIRNQNFCYIQVIVFDLSYLHLLYFSQFFHGSGLAKSQQLPLVDSIGQKF